MRRSFAVSYMPRCLSACHGTIGKFRKRVMTMANGNGKRGLNLGLGVVIGVVIGLVLDNIGLGIGIGLAIGIAMSLAGGKDPD